MFQTTNQIIVDFAIENGDFPQLYSFTRGQLRYTWCPKQNPVAIRYGDGSLATCSTRSLWGSLLVSVRNLGADEDPFPDLSHESYPQHPAFFNQDPDVSTPPYWSLVHRALAPPEWVRALNKELVAAPPSQRFHAGALKSAGETSVSQRYLLF